MKSRKIFLIVFLVMSSAVGLTMAQDYIFDEEQSVEVNEFSSQSKTITVEITDGVGSNDKG
jgi:ABC-type phosphate transport system permease subunit